VVAGQTSVGTRRASMLKNCWSRSTPSANPARQTKKKRSDVMLRRLFAVTHTPSASAGVSDDQSHCTSSHARLMTESHTNGLFSSVWQS